jgi:spore maturation protein CgeB
VHKKLNSSDEKSTLNNLDVVFVGTYTQRRAKLIKALEKAGVRVEVYGPYWRYFKRGSNVHDGVYGPEMVKVFNLAKIVLNIHMEEDFPYKVNMRTFEATGCGAFLLTDYAYGMEEMFRVNEELVIYANEDELLELAKYYLYVEGEREVIGKKAQEKAYDKHK